MDVTDLIPVDFGISAVAKQKILQELEDASVALQGDWVVALVWMVNETDGTAGPTLAFYERQDVPPESIVNIDGVELVFALTLQSKIHFEGKVLDFVNNAFLLR